MSLDACTQQNRTKETLSQQGGKMRNDSKKKKILTATCIALTLHTPPPSLSHTHFPWIWKHNSEVKHLLKY